jgi:hypothetical protein
VSLWYTTEWGPDDQSLLIASEPLTVDLRTWREVPEYSLITATRGAAPLEFHMLDLDV